MLNVLTPLTRSFFLFFTLHSAFAQSIVNVYVWGGEIPKSVIHQFERETGIHVNFTTYDNN
jgi:spermidine/putrescine transport system substrate-binding protein